MADPWAEFKAAPQRQQGNDPWAEFQPAESEGLVTRSLRVANRSLRVANRMIPGSDHMRAAVGTVVDQVTGDRRSFWDNYSDRRNRERYLDDRAVNETGVVPRVLAETVGLGATMLVTAPLMAMRPATAVTGTGTWSTVAPQATREIVADSSRIGGAFGFGQGVLDSRSPDAAGKLVDGAVGAFGGAALGLAIPAVIAGAGNARQGVRSVWERITGTTGPDRAAARVAAQEFTEAGVPIPGIAIAPEGQQTLGRALAGSVAGAPLRSQLQRSIGSTERRVADAIGPVPTRQEAGEQTQEFLRRQLLERSLSREQIAAMTPEEIASRQGIPPGGIVPEPRPVVEPIPPRDVAPVRPRPVNPDEVRVDTPRQPPRLVNPDDVPLPPEIQQRYDTALALGRQAQERRDDLVRRYNGLVAEEKAIADRSRSGQATDQDRARFGQIRQEIARLDRDEVPLLARYKTLIDDGWKALDEANVYRQQNLGTAQQQAIREAEEATRRQADAARQEAMRRMELERQQQAAAETARLRAQAQREAEEATRRAQATADKEMPQRRWDRGRSPETTYKDDFALAYGLLDKEIPKTIREPIDVKGGPFASIIDDIRGELSRRGITQGDDVSRSLRASPAADDVAAELARRLPRDVMATVMSGKPQGVAEIRQARTAIRQMQEAAPEARTLSDAQLERFESALTEQMHTLLLKRAGKALTKEWAEKLRGMSERMREVDAGYASYKQDLVSTLKPLFKDNVSADKAFDRIVASARGKNIEMLRAFMEVQAKKGDPTKATRAIIGHMNEGGIEGFIKTFGELSPEAKRILFAGRNAELGASLERLHRVANRLAPFTEAAQGSGMSPSNKINQVIGGSAVMQQWWLAAYAGAGSLGTSFAMSQPAYVNWLTKAVQMAERGATQAQMQQHAARMSVIAADDAELGAEIAKAIGEMFNGGTQQKQPLRVTISTGRVQ